METVTKVYDTFKTPIFELGSKPYLNRITMVNRIAIVMIALNVYRGIILLINSFTELDHCQASEHNEDILSWTGQCIFNGV